MENLKLDHLDKNSLKYFLEGFFTKNNIPYCFLKSYYTLEIYFNKIINRLHSFTFKGEDYLVVKKINKRDYGFLFKKPNNECLKAFIEQFKPNYVAGHYLHTSHLSADTQIHTIAKEVMCDTNIFSQDSDLRKELNQAKRINVGVFSEDFIYEKHVGDLLLFLEEWRYSRTNEQNFYAKIENDLNFIITFGHDEKIKIILLRDRERRNKIIGFNLFIIEENNQSISVLSKILRGYNNLGTFLKFSSYEKMKSLGINRVYLGGINNEFKTKYITGEPIELLEMELFINEDYAKITKDRQTYLSNYLW